MRMLLISSIPSLIKTVLLIEGNDVRFQVLEFPIFQRILLNTDTAGCWLCTMLGSKGVNALRAIDYFDVLSSITIDNVLALNARARTADRRVFHEIQEEMVKHLASFEGIIPSLFLLDRQEMTRASSKLFVQRILYLRILTPSLIAWLVLDLSFNTLMLLVYPCEFMYFVLYH